MKRIALIALSALFTLIACQKAPVQETVAKDIVFNITVNHPEDTKAVKSGWENGDKVYVFFEDITATKYLELSYNGTTWSSNLQGGLAVGDLTASGKHMYAVFFPYEQPEITSDGGTGVKFKTKDDANHTNATKGLSIYTYYMTASASYTVDTESDIATLTGTLDMVNPTGYVQFYIGKDDAKTTTHKYNADYIYRLSVDGVKPTACVSYDNGSFGTKTLNAAQPMWGYKYGDGVAFSGVIDDSWAIAADHVIYLFDTEVAAKTKTFNATLSSHDAVNFTTNPPSGWAAAATADDSPIAYEGTTWARFNLGATDVGTAPAYYGWYFTFGDIIPRRDGAVPLVGTNVYYDNTAFNEVSTANYQSLTGDFVIYDVAKAFLGPSWRLPTSSEYATLVAANTEWGGEGNKSLIANKNGSKIYFPSPGVYMNTGTYQYGGGVNGYRGGYWSSTRKIPSEVISSGNAHVLWIDPDNTSFGSWDMARSFGFSVRPVQE